MLCNRKLWTDLLALHLQQTFHQNAWSINTAPTTNFSSRCSLHSSTRRITARYNFFYKQIPWAKNKRPYLRQVDPLSLEIHCFLYYTVFYTIIHDCWNYLFLVAIRHYLIFDLFDAGVIFVLVLSMLNFIWVIYVACEGNGFRRNTTTYSTIFFWWSHYFGEAFSFKKKFNKVQKFLICCYTFFSNFSKMLFYALSSLGLLKKV